MHNLSGLAHMREYAKERARQAGFNHPHSTTNRSGAQVKIAGVNISDYQNDEDLPTVQLDLNILPGKCHHVFKTNERIEILERTFNARIDRDSYDEFHYHLHLYLFDKGVDIKQQDEKLILEGS
jgi:GH25 family lysozyme M1 (1,4-beta-N-acetylmuramidase)